MSDCASFTYERQYYSLFNTTSTYGDMETSTLFVNNWPKFEVYLCESKREIKAFEEAKTSKQRSKYRCYSNIFSLKDATWRFRFIFEDNFFFENKGKSQAEAEAWRVLQSGNNSDRLGYYTVVFINCYSKKKHQGTKKKPSFLVFSKKEDESFVEGCLTIKDLRTIYAFSNNKWRDFVNVTIFLNSNFTAIKTAKKTWKIQNIPETNSLFDIEGFIEIYLPGWLIAYMINYFCKGTNNIKAGAATPCEEGTNFFDENWISAHVGEIVSLKERPLQKADDDTCKECAFIAAACGMQKQIPCDFLKPSRFIYLSLKEAMMKINVTEYELGVKSLRSQIKTKFRMETL
ncbi:unnamed protein product [Blepharisma stoltei]|uniref:LAGLIDADG homing endonuclease n=1 Tax=Blepharisma stoltei TaxID=1481888 RepID=A0AAU9JAH3_9CILI|nr:unnamed protein product [Blepharisma stoltei]